MSRPIVLVDQDGPLAAFDRLAYARAAENGWHMDTPEHAQTARYSTDHVPDPEHRKALREMIDTTRWFRELPVVEGAVEGLHALAEIAEVWVCTKPLEVNPTCRDDKAAWLTEHFGKEWERRIIVTPDKSLVRGAVLLDDAPKPEWYDRAEWQPVAYATTWNGPGTPWGDLPRFTWDMGPDALLDMAGLP